MRNGFSILKEPILIIQKTYCSHLTVQVGSYAPNAFGLHDMHGNLWEWCADWYDADYYKNSPRQDPTGPASGTVRVARSGCWNEGLRTCRAADRSKGVPSYRSSGVGIRVLLALPAR